MYTPEPALPPTPQATPSRATPYLIGLVIAALVGAYLLAGFLARDKWAGSSTHDATHVVLSANTPDGAPPSPQALTRSQDIIGERLRDLGIEGSSVTIAGNQLIVTVPGRSADRLRGVTLSGRLYVRPVVDSAPVKDVPSTSTPPPAPGAPPGSAPNGGVPLPPDPMNDRAKAINLQKLFRQTPGLELQAAEYLQETGCNGPDLLAGNDDPNLPLVTCGGRGATNDRKMIYLLDKSIISGDQIDSASSAFDTEGNRWVVDVKFNSAAADTWADYTAAHVGTETAFVVDTQVVSAPTIREAIPGGHTQIMGDFSADSARELANTLKSGALPISFLEGPAVVKSVLVAASTPLRIGLVAAGIGVLAVAIGLVIYLLRRRGRIRAIAAQDVVSYPGSWGPPR